MAASTALLNAAGTELASLVTHIALFDGATEITGGSPAYARKAVTWTAVSGGLIRPTTDLVFDIPASVTVTEWRAFSALTGGTDYGTGDLSVQAFAAQGTYTLIAASTGIDFDAA